MMRWKIAFGVGLAAAFAVGGVMSWPQMRLAAALFTAHDDPAVLSDLTLSATGMVVSPADVEAALAADDVDLARSFVDLAASRQTVLPAGTLAAVEAAEADGMRRTALQFANGLVTGEISDGASLTGTLAGDLFVFGDIRDLVRQGHHLATGAEVDPVIVGLAGAGLAVTAATYVSAGGAAPVRAGLTLIKDARRAGRIGGELAAWTGRSARGLVDMPALQRAVAETSIVRPAGGVRAIKAALRTDKAGELFQLARDANRVRSAAGTRAAFDAMRLAEGPADIARAAKLAEKKAGQTRAIVKLLGRGALVLGSVAWWAASWLLWFAGLLIGFAASVKVTAERATERWINRRKRRLALATASS